MVRGVLKSLPPTSLNPQGEGPLRVTVCAIVYSPYPSTSAMSSALSCSRLLLSTAYMQSHFPGIPADVQFSYVLPDWLFVLDVSLLHPCIHSA